MSLCWPDLILKRIVPLGFTVVSEFGSKFPFGVFVSNP